MNKVLWRSMLCMLMAITLCCLMAMTAGAEETKPYAEQWLAQQYAEMTALGENVALQTQRYAFALWDGRQLESLCVTASGNIRFGRYGQQVRTVLIDQDTGEQVGLDALITDMDAFEERLAQYVEQYQEQLNSYLDVSDLLPVPLDTVCLTAQGLMIHYPAERFSYFSGNSGAVLVRYYLLGDLLAQGVWQDAALDAETAAQRVLSCAKAGKLYGVEQMQIGASLHAAIAEFGALTDPDYTQDSEIYEFEAPALHGVYALAQRGAEQDESARIMAVRSNEIDLCGLRVGMATPADAQALLGTPDAVMTIDAETAENERLSIGQALQYNCGDYVLRLYFETETQAFYAAEIAANP